MGSVNTILQANNKTRVAQAEYRQAAANSQNTNRAQVAQSNLSNFMRTFTNNARAKAAGKEYNFQMDQLSEELRAQSGAGLNVQMQLAQARGALAAQSGTVGVGGSSADLMDSLIRLQSEMDEEARQNALELTASRAGQQTAQIMSNAYGQMDLSQSFGQFDFQQHIEPKRMKGRFGKLVAVAVASYFGGPMAGEAVADMAVGAWQASNADYNGSGQSFGRGMTNALGAFQQWDERGGQSWGSAVIEGWGRDGGNATFTTNYNANTDTLGWGVLGGGS